MVRYDVTGMSCAACANRVEGAVSAVPGVESCAVNLMTNSMGVEGTVSADAVIAAVEAAGYGASLAEGEVSPATSSTSPAAASGKTEGTGADGTGTPGASSDSPSHAREMTAEERGLVHRLVASVAFLLPLLYLSMGHMMLSWPLPAFLDGNHVAMGLAQMTLTTAIMVINQRFFVSGTKSLAHGAPNMDTLVALGSAASFAWSLFVLFAMTGSVLAGDEEATMSYMMDFYFESAATILTLVTVGKLMEARSKGRTTDAIRQLLDLSPKVAVVVRDGEEIEVPVSEVVVGDEFVLRPGSSVPVDGRVVSGEGEFDESALTGESLPVHKAEGDVASTATTNLSGFVRCEATRVGSDTTLAQIVRMVEGASMTKAPVAKLADRVSGVFVPAVMVVSLVTLVVWLATGHAAADAIRHAVAVLVISCPCALGLATPVAIMVGSEMGAKRGILFKTAAALEETGKAKAVMLDKTGTVTEGRPAVVGVVTGEGVSEEELLSAAASAELGSQHPIADAIVAKAAEAGVGRREGGTFKSLAGRGVSLAYGDGHVILGGTTELVSSVADVDDATADVVRKSASKGQTPVLFAESAHDGLPDRLLGAILVADGIRPDSADAIGEMEDLGVHVAMVTGDSEETAASVGSSVGISDVRARVMPDGKAGVVEGLRDSHGLVIMVGDGINDAPALATADVGMAIGAGTDVAIDSADVVLTRSTLSDVARAIRLSRAVMGNIRQNLFWAFAYNVIGIPLAAGVLVPFGGPELTPTFAAAAMSLSSVSVVTNALRLGRRKGI